MRLLFVTNLYPPLELGGCEQLCHEITTLLQNRGHIVQILTSRHAITKDHPQEHGIIRTLFMQANINYYNSLDFFTRRTGQEKHNAKVLNNLIQQFSPDLIVFWSMWNLSSNLPYLAEKLMPDKVAYYIADLSPVKQDIHLEYWRTPARRRITELIKRPLRTQVLKSLAREGYPPKLSYTHAKCVSQFILDDLENAGALPYGAGIIYNGIDPHPFMVNSDLARPVYAPLRLVYFGSLLPHKGVHTAIQALGNIKRSGEIQKVDLTILGSGHPEYELYLKNLVFELGLEGKVHFLPRISRKEVPSRLANFDIFLFTSIGPEAMARTVMEAMAGGLLVIASRTGGQVEMLVDGENSLTYEPGDAVELAHKIRSVLIYPDLIKELAQAGQSMVLEKFTLDRMANEFEDWLTGILQNENFNYH
jgi:glycogen synthase